MPSDLPPDDDATRIYRPYGSPPPDPPTSPPPPASPPPTGADDPFGPWDPFQAPPPPPTGPDPPDPFAPSSPPPAYTFPDPAGRDPFAAPSPAGFAPPAPEFDPPPSPAGKADPFGPPLPAASDPFEPFLPDPFRPAAPDPFSPALPDPYRTDAPDPFRPAAGEPAAPVGLPAPDPFAAPPPYVPPPREAAPTPDPFTPPAASPPAPAAPVNESFTPPPRYANAVAPGPPSPDPFGPPALDPFAAPPPSGFALASSTPAMPSPDPFAPAARDPFQAPARSAARDPWAAPSPAGFAPAGPDPFDLGPRRDAPRPQASVPAVAGMPTAGGGRISDAFASVFALILQLRASHDFGDPAALRQRAEALLDQATARARAGGAETTDVREAEFCLVAFLDEAVLTSEWPGRDGWAAHPLQLSRYERYDAGEAFFDRLRVLLGQTGRDEVLEVYYLCIALGYKGRYQIHGREVLGQLVEDLQGRLARAPGGGARALAPHALPRGPAAVAEAGGFPTWALFVGAAVLVALLYLGLSFSVSGIAREVATDVRALPASSGSR
jgi:type VI secretion system protein ImpK